MKIILATGIYPPDIGGPATYVRVLAEEFTKRGMYVTVVTYGTKEIEAPGETEESEEQQKKWPVVWVPKWGGPLLRWWRYAKALRTHAEDVDIVIAFSLVSCGVPLWIHRKVRPLGFAPVQGPSLQGRGRGKPKLWLRLGGDFLWERYTDYGGSLGLKEWYGSRFWLLVSGCSLGWLLRGFDHIIFSTGFQEEMYEKYYPQLPPHLVIENAVPATNNQQRTTRTAHAPFRLLFMGRFVAFKNLSALLCAMTELPGVALTLMGEGPLQHFLEGNVRGLHLQERVAFHPKVTSRERDACFREHDLLIIPSVTEMSPNVALEARAAGLPVLLTEETGLSECLRQGMTIRKLRTPEQIRDAVCGVIADYEHVASEAAKPPTERSWGKVCEEYLQLFL